jgi:predicted CopG family antitoxin
MGTKTIGVRDEVSERLNVHMRGHESFTGLDEAALG